MKNKKRMTFCEKKIQELEQANKSLRAENQMLRKQLDANKTSTLLSKQQYEELAGRLAATIEQYNDKMAELTELRKKYKEAISAAYKARREYSAKMDRSLSKLEKQKV